MCTNNNNQRLNSMINEAQAVVDQQVQNDLSTEVKQFIDKLKHIEKQGFLDAFDKINESGSQLTKFLSEENLEKFSSILGNITGVTDSISSVDTKKISKVLLVVALVWSLKEKTSAILTLASCYVAYCHRDDLAELVKSLSAVPKLQKLFSHFSVENDNDDPQVIEPQGSLDSLGPEIATVLGMFLVGTKIDSKHSNVVNVLKDFSIVKNSLQSITTVIIKLVEVVLASFGLSSIFVRLFHMVNGSGETYVAFTDSVFEIDTLYEQRKFTFTIDNYEILADLLRQGEKLLRDLPRHHTTNGLFSTLNGSVQRLRSYKKAFSDSGFLVEGLRQEPVAVLLRGGPGTFKTQTMQHLAHALVSSVIDNSLRPSFNANPERFIYNRQIETEYWDGYDHDKIVTMFDDLLQMRDVASGGDSEVFNVIRGVNENGYDLHMASMDNKGSTKFRSKFIIATTNSANLKTQSIHDPRALLRRFKRTYTVLPRDEFALKNGSNLDDMNQKIDVTKLPLGELGISSTNPDDILMFAEYDLINKKHTGKVINFSGVVNELVKAHDFNKLAYDQKVLELRHRREEYNVEKQMNIFGLFRNTLPNKLTFYMKTDNSAFLGLIQDLNDDNLFQFSTFFNNLGDSDKSKLLSRAYQLVGALNSVNPSLSDSYYFNLMYSDDSDTFCEFLLNEQDNSSVLAYINVKLDLFTNVPVFCPNVVNVDANKTKNTFVSSFSRAKEAIVSLSGYNNWKSWTSVLTTVNTLSTIAVLSMGATAYYGYKNVTRKSSQGEYKMRPKKTMGKKLKASDLRKMNIHPQVSLVNDPQGTDIIKKVTKTNLYEFIVQVPDGEEMKCGFVLFIKGNFGIMPHHFMDVLVHSVEGNFDFSQVKVILRGAYNVKSGFHEVVYPLSEVLNWCYDTPLMEAQDLIGVVFEDFNSRPDITKYLATANDLSNFRKQACVLATAGSDTSFTNVMGNVVSEIYVNGDEIEDYTIARGVSYVATTRKGDCGSILGVLDPSESKRKIFGIHVAGAPKMGKGYSSLFCLEDINELIKKIDKPLISTEMQCYSLDNQDSLIGDGRFGFIRVVDQAPTLATKTKLTPSVLFNEVTETFSKPAFLRPKTIDGVLKSPWTNALSKYSSNWPLIATNVLDEAANMYKDSIFGSSPKEQEPRLFSFSEAIVGIPNTEFDCINRRTAPGYPACVSESKGHKGKTWYFGDGDEFNLESDACKSLQEDVNTTILNAANLIRDEHIFMDCLKDELRPVEKVNDYKTRLISASPLKLLVITRMYFGAFMLWYKVNRIDNQSAIGVNVFSEEWDLIAKKLLHFSPDGSLGVGAGDFSSFDGSEKPKVHNKILQIINEWYGDSQENQNIRRVLWLELTNSKHIQGNCVYEWYTSLPSGHPLTSIVNNMYNGIAFRYCWIRSRGNKSDRYDFDKYVYLITLGDDNVFSVHQRYRNEFNEVVVGKYMSELGLAYTSELKNELNEVLRPLTGVEFLKRSWRYEPIVRRYVSPLRLDGVLDTLSWTKRGNQCDVITRDKVDNCMRELSLHGVEVFNEWSTIVAKKSQECADFWPKTTSFSRNLLESCDREEFC
nr:MAG: nonstructural polyprotein [Dicistroviridae sp.]